MKIIVEEKDISKQIENFWQLESLGVENDAKEVDDLDEEIMTDFQTNIVFKDNRYKVKFPWKTNLKQSLDNNKEIASRRFLKLRTSLKNDPSLFLEYKNILDSYLAENIIEPVEDECDYNTFYLPHRAVIRNDKSTSRIRIVFDASAHAKGKLSLNDCLYTGKNLLPDLLSLLVKFRSFPIAITADIQQAFLQIEINEDDRNYTKFLWDDEPWEEEKGRKFKIFRLTRVLFGVKSSPFLLAATVKYHLQRYVKTYPETCRILNESLYVDDLIASLPDVNTAFKVSTESFNMFNEASMCLRKWKTNSIELNEKWKSQGLPLNNQEMPLEINDKNLIPSKVLGVAWDSDKDIFTFNTQTLENFISNKLSTKRFLLQTVGRIYDPIGFLSPYTIRIKCLIQEIWSLGLDWDENLPKHLDKIWNQWTEEIVELNDIKIPRHYLAGVALEEIDHIELHSFGDASKKAYGTVIYLRGVLKNKEIITSFVAAKSRVAPLKTVSIPRLELLGALLSARLSHKITKSLAFPVVHYFWTDSSITYYWIKGDSEKYKMFVRNRIKEIQNLSDSSSWFHCPGYDNPADIITRGLKISELKNNRLWWEGPQWLNQDKSLWPNFEESLKTSDTFECEDQLELKKNIVVKANILSENQTSNELINRYSSFTKLIRISAWCLRFLNNCKLESTSRKYSHVDTYELQNAAQKLIKVVQYSTFETEIKCLKKKHPLPNNSKILNLNVFLDEKDLLRIGGRLKFSNVSEDQKNQILLPKRHHFTDLLIDYYHRKFLHSSTLTTLSLIRQSYWILTGQNEVRRIIRKCMTCFRLKKQSIQQMMGDLPRDRIIPSRPFEKTGVDLAGPIITKPNLKRSRIKLKSYIALFICFSTKAVHLEVVSDLTSEAFLASLRRFIARRSRPSIIWSDNATNFRGTSTLLKSFFRICASSKIQKFVAEEEIQWNFIPPASPHFGGLWESNIKSMKQILIKITNSSLLNFEELSTVVTQIEAVLNSRPLTPLSDDPNDLQPLTPGHFLVGAPLLSIPECNPVLDSLPLSSRWTLIQRLKNQFWTRWSRDYLNELQTRKKWKKVLPNIKTGQLVLLKEPQEHPQGWRLARVIKVHPGMDNFVRVVDLKTASGTLRRSITKIVPLPFESYDVGHSPNGGRDVPIDEN